MALADTDTSWLDELADKLEGMTTTELPAIERAGLRNVNTVVKPALVAATPIAFQIPAPLSNALPTGKLRASVRARVLEPRGDLGRAAVLDFGKLSHIAGWVDGGHVLVKGGRRGKGKEIGHVPAYPFIRTVEDTMTEEAQEAMVAGAEAEVDRILKDG